MKIINLTNKIFILSFTPFFFSYNPLPSYSEEIIRLNPEQQLQQESAIPEYIAEAQWAAVEKLQKLLQEKNYEKAFLCFSEGLREKITRAQNNDPNFLDYFFTQWTLNEKNSQSYKELVYKGKGVFIFDVKEQEWKINEI